MSIIRTARPERNFTIISNEIIRNQKLSRSARALLIEILSYPDNWRTSSIDLARAGLEGRDAIRRMLRELTAARYCRIVRGQDERGRWTSAWYFYDTPIPEEEFIEPPHRKNVDNMGTTQEKETTPRTPNPSSVTQALYEDSLNNNSVKKSETFSELLVRTCGQCKGQGWTVDSVDVVTRCPSCQGDGIAR